MENTIEGQAHSIKVMDLKASRKALIGGSLGNLLEWYEFAIYAYMAPIIGPLFFDTSNAATAILATFSIYALAFFLRPVGAILFGRWADRVGRRASLVWIITLMTLATALIGLLPTYAQIGMWAPILLTLFRVVQGLCSGGEMGGAVSLMVESAPEGKRGLYGSWSFAGTALGYVLGGGVATVLATVFTPEVLISVGWRMGFLLAVPMGIIILYLRMNIDETPYFKEVSAPDQGSAATQEASLIPAAVKHPSIGLLVSVGIVVVWNAVGHTFMVGMPAFLSHFYGMSFKDSYLLALVTGLVAALSMPFFGTLSDKLGRKPVLLAGAAGVFVLSYPLYAMMSAGFNLSILALTLAGILIGMLGGPMPALLSERFRTRNRATGVALTYALGVAVFGGTAPFIVTWIADLTGDPLAAAYYTVGCSAISFLALVCAQGKTHQQMMVN
ncbi:MFS transporter [Pseudomonas typographi]|uniref:MFS transporter n=1 Tax=Pseudomonas typographi TaxID=2715964 RepID=UPI00168283D5|nr:MFS transporter [Pseudomonas typographi]MBD1587908.1 MHS family MFS transporter [Pseudomonas typographi]